MPTIRDLSPNARARGYPGTVWRDELLPAHYDGRAFHVDSGSTEGGRRIVTHQFPKKELPYSEDMGRKAREWTVRGYIISYPHDDPAATGGALLYQRDYRTARDELRYRLDLGKPGVLQLPTFIRDPMVVVCPRYRLTEEDKLGGFCVFDMQFVEYGIPPGRPLPDSRGDLLEQANALKLQVANVWQQQTTKTSPVRLQPFRPSPTRF